MAQVVRRVAAALSHEISRFLSLSEIRNVKLLFFCDSGLTKDLGNCRLLSELFWKHRCTPQIAELFFGHPRLALTTAIIINIITPPSSSIWQLHFSRASIGSLWVKEHRAVLSESTHPLPWLFYYVVSEVNTRAFLLDNFPTLVLTLGSSTHFSAS